MWPLVPVFHSPDFSLSAAGRPAAAVATPRERRLHLFQTGASLAFERGPLYPDGASCR